MEKPLVVASQNKLAPPAMPAAAVVAYSLVTPFGSASQTVKALQEQRSAFTASTDESSLRNRLAATIPRVSVSQTDDGKWQRHLAMRVLQDAIGTQLSDFRERQHRTGFIFSTSYGHLLDDGRDDTMSAWAQDCLHDLGLEASPIVVGSGCSSSSDGMVVAAAMLADGTVDAAVVVAVDIVTRAKLLAHSKLGTMTRDIPRPFDVDRSGILLGEAAATIIMRRSSDVSAHEGELVGVGSSNDAYSLTAPDPSGTAVKGAIDRALRSANLSPKDIGIYYAHGTGTDLNDAVEAKVVAEYFSQNTELTLIGTKGALGHSLGACGAVEFVLLIEMLKSGIVPPTVGMARPVSSISHRFPRAARHGGRARYGLSVTLGFGGFNTALIVRAHPTEKPDPSETDVAQFAKAAR